MKTNNTGKLTEFLSAEKAMLAVITITGLFYNVGMVAGPWFEGQLAGYLCDIIGGTRKSMDIYLLAVWYVLVIVLVQGMRFFKRLFVRKFANHMNLSMKERLYWNLLHKTKQEMDQEETGTVMTKAISDVDACVEGVRKFVTEIFDTGVVMIAYLAMLFFYDVRLTFLVMLFPPVAYVVAEKLKVVVTQNAARSRESAGKLNGVTLDRIGNAMTYRVYGQEKNQNLLYDQILSEYEKKAVYANIWENTMQPLYQIIAMAGTVFILYFGGKNVLHIGWNLWDIAAFSTYLSCFTKLAVKSSKAAKLVNAVQKAKVSWERIAPFMKYVQTEETKETVISFDKKQEENLQVSGLSFSYPDGKQIIKNVTFSAKGGEIIGITGEVACGKSTLGKVFLGESAYGGSIQVCGRELSELTGRQNTFVGYMGHEPELFSGSVRENICLGKEGDVLPVLEAVCLKEEVLSWENGIETMIGSEGVRISGGQQARIALARLLYHKRALMILDDPFSAVDAKTEQQIFENIQKNLGESIVLLISHRLRCFEKMDGVLWLENGESVLKTHDGLLKENETYRHLYDLQKTGGAS